MQQRFLQACAKQLLSLGTVPRAGKLISLLTEHLDTDLSAGNMAFFLRQLLLCRGEDIHFWTAPCTPEIISGYSYAVLDLEPWLDMLNLRLKPLETDIPRLRSWTWSIAAGGRLRAPRACTERGLLVTTQPRPSSAPRRL